MNGPTGSEWITCSVCGTRFDPDLSSACPSCPLQQSCQLACCPNCGFQMLLTRRSALARLAERLLSKPSGSTSLQPDLGEKS